MSKKIKVTVVGSGYVGMSLAVLLAQHNEVVVLDIDSDRVSKVNKNLSTIEDHEISYFLENKKLNLTATLDKQFAYSGAKFVIVATPTNYDPLTNHFDTKSVDACVSDALELTEHDALVVIKSTIPVGHTRSLQIAHNTDRVIFSPEFLREGQALYDNLFPSRIIVGSILRSGKAFADLLAQAAEKSDVEILFMPSTEAEAVKLFANTYLAMRVAFFNELDSYAIGNELNAAKIIEGVCLDARIGKGYNNPSFGYGGYCLPKDTKQLRYNFQDIPQSLVDAIITSNDLRKRYLSKKIVERKAKTVGFYGLAMKEGSDNFRDSAIQDLIRITSRDPVSILIYDQNIEGDEFDGFKVEKNLKKFKEASDLIVTNRESVDLDDVRERVFTRDIFGEN